MQLQLVLSCGGPVLVLPLLEPEILCLQDDHRRTQPSGGSLPAPHHVTAGLLSTSPLTANSLARQSQK